MSNIIQSITRATDIINSALTAIVTSPMHVNGPSNTPVVLSDGTVVQNPHDVHLHNLNPDQNPNTIQSDDRFNDVEGPQTNVNGFDLSSNNEADAIFGYLGEDGEGAWVIGGGLVDWQNDDPNQWFQSFEIFTAEGQGNLIGEFDNDDFWGLGFDAQFLEAEFDISGHSLNAGYLNANGNYGGDEDGYGLMFNANLADVQYSNGAPSADNSNDIGVDFGASAGIGAGLNFVYSDPDGDGITNLGVDISAGPVDIGFTSEWLGGHAENLAEDAGEAFVDFAYGVEDTLDSWGNLINGGGGLLGRF